MDVHDSSWRVPGSSFVMNSTEGRI
jgi:hypothetical protein